jgi:YfiH family protein
MTPPVSGSFGEGSRPTPRGAADFDWHPSAAGRIQRSSALAAVADHVFTSRDLTFQPATFDDDLARLGAALGVSPSSIARVRQVHGRAIRTISAGEPIGTETALPAADAIVSTDPSRVVAVQVADCVPILIADRHHRVVAAVHAGWRGTCAGVAAAVVESIVEMGVEASDLVAALGPGIGPCCYQVDGRVRTAFLAMTPDAVSWFTEDGLERWKLDLWRANVEQLEGAGMTLAAIEVSGICTADHLETCFSYRREGGGAGRMMAAIRLRPALAART